MTEPPPFSFPRLDDMRRLLELANALHAASPAGRAQRLAVETAALLAARSVTVGVRPAAGASWTVLAVAGEPPPYDGAGVGSVGVGVGVGVGGSGNVHVGVVSPGGDGPAGPDGPPHEVGLLAGGDGRPPGVRSVLRQGGRITAVTAWRRTPFEAGHVDLLRLLHPAAAWAIDQPDVGEGLSAGAEAVLSLMLTGLPEKEIARRLGRSVHTVHTHIKRVYRHFGVNSRPELLALRYDRQHPPKH